MNESIVAECKEAAAVLQAKGVRLVFLSLTYDLDAQLMVELTGSNDTVQFRDPYWQAGPRDVQRWFNYTIGCPTEEPFVPCGDNGGLQINLFFYLNKDTIKKEQLEVVLTQYRSSALLQTIKNFLTDEFFDGWTHAERISLVFSCAKGKGRVPPDTFANYKDLTSAIEHAYSDAPDSCSQGGYIGRNISSAAVYFLRGYGINYYRQAYVAFASTLNDEDVKNIRKTSPFIHGPLTIVALNGGVKTNATNAGLNVIDWSDPNKSAPDGWKQKCWAAFGSKSVT
ncbi:hypothetical protein M3Y99_01633700 [Aphelenchoides fujianensis]|nr:hypothetical protein M3Y99_01633700 [Aphelenchoides fujianensis]